MTTASAHLRPGGEYPGAGADVLITDRAPAQHCPYTPPPVNRLSPTCYTRLTHHQHMTMGGSRGAITDKESVQYCQAEVRILRYELQGCYKSCVKVERLMCGLVVCK